MRDPSAYLFVNEGNKTGNLIFGLCFPMVPIAADEPHLERGESGNGGAQEGYREGEGAAGWAPARYSWTGKLGRQAGCFAT